MKNGLPSVLGAVLTLCAISASALAQQTAEQRQAAVLLNEIQIFEQVVGIAERACLSNVTRTDRAGVTLNLQALVNAVKSGVGIERRTEELRGASQQLSGEIAKIENDEIRRCMNQYVAPIFGLTLARYEKPEANVAWPDPIDFRFNFARHSSGDTARISDTLRINLLRTSRPPFARRITYQYDGTGSTYFQLDLPYPADDEIIKGTITPEINGDARLSTEPPSITELCLQRPAPFPKIKAEHDLFECDEGNACQPARMGTGWLSGCKEQSGAIRPTEPPNLLHRASYQLAQAGAGAAARRWIAPSLESISRGGTEGVGYTVFTIETPAFMQRGVLGVEFDVRVNGTRVEEDGLAPEVRPLPNDPEKRFVHAFALQSLNFQGAQGGCDMIEIGLKPLLPKGEKGSNRTAVLSYAALRDVEERKERLGDDATLTWRASYITPAREWRHIPIVHSYIYPVESAERRDVAARQAMAHKRWLDEQRLLYRDQQVVGVIRPPRTIQANGTAAFGLAIGLFQPTGQIRFTFSEGEAREISRFMIAQRGRPGATRIIAPEVYVFQAFGGSRTVPGVCAAG